MGVHILMGGVINAVIQPNMQLLMGDVHQGTLDFALTKPVDAQVIISIREFRIWQVVDILVGLVVLVVAVVELRIGVGLWASLGFVAALLMGAAMIYCFWLMLTTTSFWIVRMHDMINLFQGLYAAGRWPVGIYPAWLKASLTFLVPVAFAVTVPAEALTGRLTSLTLLGAFILTSALIGVSRWFLRVGLRNYSGASA